jgi:hypothetical protein
MNAFQKLGSSAARLISVSCALIAMLLVFVSGPNQEAGLFGVIILLAITSSILWTTADWISHALSPELATQT